LPWSLIAEDEALTPELAAFVPAPAAREGTERVAVVRVGVARCELQSVLERAVAQSEAPRLVACSASPRCTRPSAMPVRELLELPVIAAFCSMPGSVTSRAVWRALSIASLTWPSMFWPETYWFAASTIEPVLFSLVGSKPERPERAPVVALVPAVCRAPPVAEVPAVEVPLP
jgi:hypothetical protein